MMTRTTNAGAPRAGFTLLELIVVIVILAALAGLVISRVDWARRTTDTATAAAGMAQVHGNLQLYRTAKGTYPDRFDSLLDSTTVATTPAIYGPVFDHVAPRFQATTIPAPPPGPPSGPIFSLQHVGMVSVMDQNPTATFPGDSGTVVRALDFSVATPVVTVVASSAIERAIYPTGKPADVTLIALGVGPSCTAVGSTMSAAPLGSELDPSTTYPRFIAIFACFANGKRAELKTVVDPSGQVLGAQLRNFHEAGLD